MLRPLKIVIDCGNAVAAGVAPDLFRKLGCEVIELFCEVDGGFPNHEPDPTRSENLTALQAAVINEGADLGLAFDGDGDRVGLVTDQGKIIPADRLLMLLVESLAEKYPGATVVYDVKCSRELGNIIEKLGLKPVMHKSGHTLMRQKIEQTAAPLEVNFQHISFLKTAGLDLTMACMPLPEFWSFSPDTPEAATKNLEPFPVIRYRRNQA